MDLSTAYLGLKLRNPLLVGASSLAGDLDRAKRLADAGAAGLVLHSLFQEQIQHGGEASLSLPPAHTPDGYLEHIQSLKKSAGIPVIASLNGADNSAWTRSAKLIQQAGADALELNIYYLGANSKETGADVEKRAVDIVRSVKETVSLPIAVKLLPFYSSLANLAARIDDLGASGIVLFNRVYQPEIDSELLEFASPNIQLTDHSELALRLHWLAVLSGRVRCSLGASGGVQSGLDAAKAIMAGASAVQVVSILLRRGPEHLRVLLKELSAWMDQHNQSSVSGMCGKMNLNRCLDPGAYERANYMRVLQGWK